MYLCQKYLKQIFFQINEENPIFPSNNDISSKVETTSNNPKPSFKKTLKTKNSQASLEEVLFFFKFNKQSEKKVLKDF